MSWNLSNVSKRKLSNFLKHSNLFDVWCVQEPLLIDDANVTDESVIEIKLGGHIIMSNRNNGDRLFEPLLA